MKKNKTSNIALNSIFVALIFISAQLINIPTAIGGVINVTDSIILLSSIILTRNNATLVSGTGAFMAEIISPYAIFAPATLIIKSSMAFVANTLFNKLNIKNEVIRMLISFTVAELIMISGYFIYQAFFLQLGIYVASLDIVNNIIQAIASIVIAIFLAKLVKPIFNQTKAVTN